MPKLLIVTSQGPDNATSASVPFHTAANGEKVLSHAMFYRKLWALGPAGVDVPLTLYREGDTFDVGVTSSDRARFLKCPKLH